MIQRAEMYVLNAEVSDLTHDIEWFHQSTAQHGPQTNPKLI